MLRAALEELAAAERDRREADKDPVPHSDGATGDRVMKALPFWQPWATLVAVGAKRIETRSWPCPVVGQRIAIHATKTDRAMQLCAEEPFFGALVRAGHHFPLGRRLPFGALIATAVVDRCVPTDELSATLDPDELAFGDYSPGRYAWVLRDVEQLPKPVPWRGSQGMFNVPAEIVGV